MEDIVTNSKQRENQHQYSITGTATLNTAGEDFFFYSNEPETVKATDLADAGKWLNMASVYGKGQVYAWHKNGAGIKINSYLLIYNPGSSAITVKATRYGTTNAADVSDSNAWASYFGSSNVSVTIQAGQWGSLFSQSVAKDNHYGYVAYVSITNSSGNPMGAVFYDLAYNTNSSGATMCASIEKGGKRGLGVKFTTTVNLNTITMTASNMVGGLACTFGGITDTFSGTDRAYITDGSGATTGYLNGCFGQVLDITMPIKNTTGVSRSFYIYYGSIVQPKGFSFPLVVLGNKIAKYIWIKGGEYVDVIDTGPIDNTKTKTINFKAVIPGVSMTLIAIGVRSKP